MIFIGVLLMLDGLLVTHILCNYLCNGSTTLMFEGVPTYPDASRFWQIVEKFKVNIFYTLSAIRALMGLGDSF